MADQKALEKDLAALKVKALSASSVQGALDDVKKVDGVSVLVREVSAETPGALRDLGDQLKSKLQSGIIVLGSKTAQKVMLVVVVTKDLLKQHHAGNIIKQVVAMVGGGGGGRPDMAQAGGSKPEKLSDALAAVHDIVLKK